MNTTSKLTIGLSVAGGALLAAWLLTGERKQKTRKFVSRRKQSLKDALKKERGSLDDYDVYYV